MQPENAASTILFLDALDHSFLSEKDKKELRDRALQGVETRLWDEFNARLIAAIARAQEQQRALTAEYEKEKALIDEKLRADLAGADDAEQERLWEHYREAISALQTALLKKAKD